MAKFRYLYLHGFGSNANSIKGAQLHERMAAAGCELERLDINRPNFELQTYSAVLDYLSDVDRETQEGVQIRLAGSSTGGYLAARWAELNPQRVDRLFLLCPGFELAARWPLMVGEAAMRQWELDGQLEVETVDGSKHPLHWQFVLDSRAHPAYPEVACPTLIVHGSQDEIVPFEFSRRYADRHDNVQLIELEDDHRLLSTVEPIGDALIDHFV